MSHVRDDIAVIIPMHNGERFIEAAIASVRAQSVVPSEVVVVDDGSTDRGPELAEAAGVTLVRQAHLGVAAARNAGVGRTESTFVAFLDADDTWNPRKLELQRAAMLDGGADFCAGHMEQVLEPGLARPDWVRDEMWDAARPCYLPSGWMVRRSFFEQVGPFNESFEVGEDTEWLVRARRAGMREVVLDDVLVYRRIHENNLTGRVREGRENLFKALRASLPRTRAGE